MQKKSAPHKPEECSFKFMAIRDTMEILSGKWKVQIIGALMQRGTLRFMDLLRELDGIAAKMLSKELQELELNELVTRKVCDTKPITVEYTLTTYAGSLQKVIYEMAIWGEAHRKRVMKKTPKPQKGA